MLVSEITRHKPLTPERARIASLQRNVQNAKLALHRERDRQQRQRSAKRLQHLQQTKTV